jgi:hypothetical protein
LWEIRQKFHFKEATKEGIEKCGRKGGKTQKENIVDGK